MKDLLERARGDGKRIVTVPDSTREDLRSTSDIEGGEIRDVDVFKNEWEDSFEFEWVNESELSQEEKEVWELREKVLSLVGLNSQINEIRVSETMRSIEDGWKAAGLWEPGNRRIVIKRDALSHPSRFIGLLLHEAAHAKSGATDQTREFEGGLTDLLGIAGAAAIQGDRNLSQEDLNPVSNN
jgi:hypothetical protein